MNQQTVKHTSWNFWVLPLVLALAGIGLYAANAGDFFRSDDFVSIAGATTAPHTYFIGENFAGSTFYRPGTLVSFWLDRQLWGLNPWGYHLTNLLLFAGTILCFFLLLALLFADRRIAILATLVLVIHPAHADSVAWISGRTELLFAFFTLAAMVCFVRFRTGPKGWWLYALSLVFTVLALCGKENAILIPLLIIAADRFREKDASQKLPFVHYLPYFLIVAAYLVLRTWILGGIGGYGSMHTQVGLFVIRNVFRYVLYFMVPVDLNQYVHHFLRYEAIFYLVGAAFIAACIYLLRNQIRSRSFLFGLTLTLLALAPCANLFPHNRHALSIHFGLTVAAASILVAVLSGSEWKRWVGGALVLAWIVTLGALSIRTSAVMRTASQISKKAVLQSSAIAGSTQGPVSLFALTVPDTYRGVFVLRNGLHQALQLFGPDKKVIAHRFVLVGYDDPTGPQLGITSSGASGFDIVMPAGQSGYLLLPDANWSRHLGDTAVIGPGAYTITDESRRFRVNGIRLKIDPKVLFLSGTQVSAFVNGQMKTFR